MEKLMRFNRKQTTNKQKKKKQGCAHLKISLGYEIAHPLDHPDGFPVWICQSVWNNCTYCQCVEEYKWSYSWTINTGGSFFFHKEKCSSSRKLVCFAHFQTFICQPGLQRSSPARLIFPEKSIALQKNSAFVQPLKTLGLRFLPSVFSLVGSSTCFDKG